jgi:hypothetical protein
MELPTKRFRRTQTIGQLQATMHADHTPWLHLISYTGKLYFLSNGVHVLTKNQTETVVEVLSRLLHHPHIQLIACVGYTAYAPSSVSPLTYMIHPQGFSYHPITPSYPSIAHETNADGESSTDSIRALGRCKCRDWPKNNIFRNMISA